MNQLLKGILKFLMKVRQFLHNLFLNSQSLNNSKLVMGKISKIKLKLFNKIISKILPKIKLLFLGIPKFLMKVSQFLQNQSPN